jgi:hypothetical protein
MISSLCLAILWVYGLRDLSTYATPFSDWSELLFSLSLLLAAFWSLSASTRVLVYLWLSFAMLAAIFFAVDFYIITKWYGVYGSVSKLRFKCISYPVFIGTAAHLLHLLLKDRCKTL